MVIIGPKSESAPGAKQTPRGVLAVAQMHLLGKEDPNSAPRAAPAVPLGGRSRPQELGRAPTGGFTAGLLPASSAPTKQMLEDLNCQAHDTC